MEDLSGVLASLKSGPASRGFTGFWEFPEMKITWSFDAGLPDPATFPVADLSRLAGEVLGDDAASALQYGAAQSGSITYGYEGLRDLLAERTKRLEGRAELDRKGVMLTLGGIQGISLACDAFLDPGDVVALEAPTWGAVLGAAARVQAEAVAIPMDRDGMRIDVLEQELERLEGEGKRLKLLYTIATFNTPTGWSMSLPRRKRLLELAGEHQFIVLEDNVYGELRYDGEPIPTLFALDETGLVVKVDSFSKTLAPALRIGWVSGHPDVIGALSSVKGDLGVSQWLGRVVARFMQADLLEAHIAKVNALYRRKRDVCADALREYCSPWVTFDSPDGGFFHWVKLSEDVDGAQVMQKALAEGVQCRPGERFYGDSEEDVHNQWLRIAFPMPPVEEIERGIAALGKAIADSVK